MFAFRREKKISDSDVIDIYKILLDREPESEAVIDGYKAFGSWESIVRAIGNSEEFADRVRKSPFYYYHSCFDAVGTLRGHAVPSLEPREGYVTNYLGVLVDPKFQPNLLKEKAGQVESIPIPSNWHADIAEWAAALRAVDFARETFTMVELGCGWGCWMNNTGMAAKRKGKKVHVIGVEGDVGHLAFARESCAVNGFDAGEITLHHGIAAATSGIALFPRQVAAGSDWGLQPIFNADDDERMRARSSGRYEELPMIALDQVIGDHDRLDLLHVDIQGGEADLVDECLETLCGRVAYMVIGTHSRQIEGRIMDTLLKAGWRLEIERPAILTLSDKGPDVVVDGVQGWRNPALLPDAGR
ncbi:MAG TPA: hypothetical protein VEY95_12905 [Azospirillaceae bacterium]|nr:hypothetical protein [Azospirillaceae bacterium]